MEGSVENIDQGSQDSIGNAINQANAGRVMSGHPAEQDAVNSESKKEDQETLEEKEASKKAESGNQEKEAEVKEKEVKNPAFKYGSHEEAEKAALEATRKMTDATTRLREAEQKLEDLKKPSSEQKQDQSVEQKDEPDAYVVQRRKKALAEINALDPEEEDHEDKVAEIWAKADRDINGHFQNQRDQENKKERQKRQEADDKAKADQEFLDSISKALTDADLDGDLDSTDTILFGHFAKQVPNEGTMEEQISKAIEMVKNYKQQLIQPYIESNEQANKTQAENQVMGRQGSGRPPEKEKPAKRISLGDTLSIVQSARVIG